MKSTEDEGEPPVSTADLKCWKLVRLPCWILVAISLTVPLIIAGAIVTAIFVITSNNDAQDQSPESTSLAALVGAMDETDATSGWCKTFDNGHQVCYDENCEDSSFEDTHDCDCEVSIDGKICNSCSLCPSGSTAISFDCENLRTGLMLECEEQDTSWLSTQAPTTEDELFLSSTTSSCVRVDSTEICSRVECQGTDCECEVDFDGTKCNSCSLCHSDPNNLYIDCQNIGENGFVLGCESYGAVSGVGQEKEFEFDSVVDRWCYTYDIDGGVEECTEVECDGEAQCKCSVVVGGVPCNACFTCPSDPFMQYTDCTNIGMPGWDILDECT